MAGTARATEHSRQGELYAGTSLTPVPRAVVVFGRGKDHPQHVATPAVLPRAQSVKRRRGMEVFPGGRISEVVAVRLDRGDDVLASLERVAREQDIHTGVIISGIGTLDKARLHYITHTGFPSENRFVEHEGPIELVSVDGIIADHMPHLHTCISVGDDTYMGHLEPGCRVLYLAEIAIARADGLRLTRRTNEETGISQLRAGG
jgi:predicted DNA-binding protein with PD1-like motif